MRFSVRFAIGGRLGAASIYSLRNVCLCLIDRYALTEVEVCTIVTLQPGEKFSNNDLEITRQEASKNKRSTLHK